MDNARRATILGLSLLALVALGGMVTSSAYAGEFITCSKTSEVTEGKVKHYTGSYKNAECTEGEIDGEYESAPAPDTPFTATSKTVVTETAAGDSTCKASSSSGTTTGLIDGEEITRFKGCDSLTETDGSCTSEGAELGEVVFYDATTLLDHGETGPGGGEPASGEVWDELAPLPGSPVYPYDAEYVCSPGVLFRTGGTLAGVVSDVNEKASTKGGVTFGAGKGEQGLVTEYSENGGVSWEPTGPNIEKRTDAVKYSAAIEIRGR